MRPPHPLWGSILDSVAVDLLQGNVTFELHTVDRTSEPPVRRHTIRCESVSTLRFYNEIPLPWEYAEITEIRTSLVLRDRTEVDLMLWSEDAGMTITAERILFDGEDAYRYLTDNA
jgi:hypothetical protein